MRRAARLFEVADLVAPFVALTLARWSTWGSTIPDSRLCPGRLRAASYSTRWRLRSRSGHRPACRCRVKPRSGFCVHHLLSCRRPRLGINDRGDQLPQFVAFRHAGIDRHRRHIRYQPPELPLFPLLPLLLLPPPLFTTSGPLPENILTPARRRPVLRSRRRRRRSSRPATSFEPRRCRAANLFPMLWHWNTVRFCGRLWLELRWCSTCRHRPAPVRTISARHRGCAVARQSRPSC